MNEASRRAEPSVGAPSSRRDGLTVLFDAHFDDVYRFCLARSGDRGVADDAASEAFLAAARLFAKGEGDAVDRPWLFVVARRRLCDHWRAERRHNRRLERLKHVSIQEPLPDEGGVDVDLVLTALGSLPERQRAAVSLRYLDEFSVSEVAEALEVPYRAAESLLARGRRGFAQAWEELT